MTQDSKNLINNFLIKGFNIKKIKNNSGKWSRVIIITEGYVRQDRKMYNWSQGIDSELAVADLITLLTNVFACTSKESMMLAMDFLNTCPVLNTVHTKSNKTPIKRVITSNRTNKNFTKPKKY